MVRTLVSIHHPVLHGICTPIAQEDIKSDRIQTLIADMKEILVGTAYGVAIAAPQVGEPLCLFVVRLPMQADEKANENTVARGDTKLKNSGKYSVYINPEIIKISRKRGEKHEGCLSIPGLWGVVPRAEQATIRAYNEDGREFTQGASGLLAQIFQHEMDHLNGTLYTDKASATYTEDEVASEEQQ